MTATPPISFRLTHADRIAIRELAHLLGQAARRDCIGKVYTDTQSIRVAVYTLRDSLKATLEQQ